MNHRQNTLNLDCASSKATISSDGKPHVRSASRPATPLRRQSGTVLIVSLIMLTLLTLIGATSSQVTGMEEKMSGNSKNLNLAFQAAESALRAGEAATATITSSGYYTGSMQSIDWNNANAKTYTSGTLTGVYQAPKYIIEAPTYTPGGDDSGGTIEVPAAGGSSNVAWYRITARGTGGTPNSMVTLQTYYRR